MSQTQNDALRAQLEAALASANMQAFLRMIRAGETSQGDEAYRMQFGGGLVENLRDHPRQAITRKLGGRPITSTAAGAYQFLSRTWDECAAALGLPDFSPASQDLAAVFLINRRRALDDVLAGRVEQAIGKCAREWASLPGSPYGQPMKTLAQALEVYRQHGGTFDAPAAATQATEPPAPETPASEPIPINPPAESTPMPLPLIPIISAVLPSLVEAIPQLGKLFGSGSEVSQRNVQAAALAVEIARDAVGAGNAQAAAEIIAADPAKAEEAKAAIAARWLELTEAGGGGIEGARAADARVALAGGLLHSPSFWVALLLLPLAYMIVGAVVGLFGTPFADEVRAAIANGVIGMILGGLIGYYYGQTTSRNRN